MKEVRIALFDVVNGQLSVVTCKTLDDYYKYLNCDCFDITARLVSGRAFDIYVDDEGLLKDSIVISAVDSNDRVALVGNLIFAHHNYEGDTTSITDDDIELLKSAVHTGVYNGTVVNFMYPIDY